jgi:AcrR family transcriptional regulator
MASEPAELSVRKDVLRNRGKIVAAAREIFAREGLGASLEPIAKAAGVGNATLYRHFPTRSALWEAVLADPLREVLAVVDEALRLEDTGDGIAHYLKGTLAIESRRGGFAALMTTRYEDAPFLAELRGAIQQGVDALVTRAVEEKAIRADVTETDFAVIAVALSTVVQATRAVAPDVWQRMLGIVLDGLRPLDARPLPAPPLKPNQVWRAYTRPIAQRNTGSTRPDK